ncbi:MAG: hypothetical protein SFT81_03790 [Candidatus Caenarcaniphilales bacterium]|nr:hypothetical protein [Candidatus Caenarcaniphilales bacterium]
MTAGNNVNSDSIFPNYNSFNQIGTQNLGVVNGFGSTPIGGYSTIGTSDGDFQSLLFGLNSSGGFGASLNANAGVAGVNQQGFAFLSEGASALTSNLLNRVAPLDVPLEAQYSSSAFGGINSGLSIFDTFSALAGGLASSLGLGGDLLRYLQILGPAVGGVGAIMGVFQGLNSLSQTPEPNLQTSYQGLEDLRQDYELSS